MNRRLLRSLTLLAAATALLFAACKQKQAPAPQEDQPTNYELAMTGHDTLAVTNLVNEFFGHLEQGEVTDAIAMLYIVDNNDPYQEPQLLDNDQIAQFTSTYTALPITDHRIEYIKFYDAALNEVKVSAIIAPAEGDMPEVKTVFYFRPYDYLGGWRLCVIDSRRGDERVLTNEQADRLEEEFSQASN